MENLLDIDLRVWDSNVPKEGIENKEKESSILAVVKTNLQRPITEVEKENQKYSESETFNSTTAISQETAKCQDIGKTYFSEPFSYFSCYPPILYFTNPEPNRFDKS